MKERERKKERKRKNERRKKKNNEGKKKANRQIMCKHVERRNQSAHRSKSGEGINENSEDPMIILNKLLIHEDCELL